MRYKSCNIFLIGNSKAGKTTFVNAVLKRNIYTTSIYKSTLVINNTLIKFIDFPGELIY